jgi:hypothetical protein
MADPAPPVRQLTIACARCGRPAAEITLSPGAAEAAEPGARRDRLERAGFLGHVTCYGAYADLERLYVTLERGDLQAARGADADFVAFFCRRCGRPYCEACWGPRRLVFDDGFYDCAYADCPEGHEQIVDD